MKTVTFKFDIDQKVRVEKLGITGIITTCAVDDGGITYHIRNEKDGYWFPERLLTDAEG
jgi:hypothetical protein